MSDFRTLLYSRYVSTFKGNTFNTTISQSYSKWCDTKYLPYLDDLSLSSSILELGCGQGQFLEYLSARGFHESEGIDLSDEQVAVALERGLKVRVANVFDLLKEEGRQFDCIVAFDLIEHFTKDELLEFFSGVYDILTPCGILLLQTPNGQGLFPGHVVYGDLTHMTIFNMSSLTQILQYAGFTNIRFEDTAPIVVGFRSRIRIISWKLIKSVANMIRWIETGKTQTIWSQNLICISQKQP